MVDGQTILVALIIATAVSYLAYKLWSARKAGCGGGGCACAGKQTKSNDGLISKDQLTLRLRNPSNS